MLDKMLLITRIMFNSVRFIGKPCSKSILRASLGAHFKMSRAARVIIGKGFTMRSGASLEVCDNACLKIGTKVFMNCNCQCVCRNRIEIGDNTLFGPGCLIYDHDHRFEKDTGVSHNEFSHGTIKIGRNCWFGGNVVILKNTEIGDNCIIGAGTVVSGKIPNNTLLLQKREMISKQIL